MPKIWKNLFILGSCLLIFLACEKKPKVHRCEKMSTIIGRYMAYACGDFCPQISPITDVKGFLSQNADGFAFRFWVQKGMNSPDTIDKLAVPGNQFELVGYCYYKTENNEKILHHRFDLVSWRILTPFYEWDINGNKIEKLDSDRYTKFNNASETAGIKFKPARRYDPL